METIRETLFSNWNFMRWLRLVLGIIAGIQAIQFHDTLLGFLSAFLLFQSLTNTGCCGAGGCSVPRQRQEPTKTEDTTYEEVK
ncbi:MAG: hypothetical protein ACTHK8_02720 [Ginsengibacter sp.]